LSELEVPIAYNVGTNSGPGACVRWGYSVPFGDALLKSLYRNHGQYVSHASQVNESNVDAGYILPDDAELSTDAAAQSRVGK